VKRFVSCIALAAFGFCYFVPVSKALVCVDPKMKSAESCGFALDPYGEPVPNAVIHFKDSTHEDTATADASGHFDVIHFSGTRVEVKVTAAGFMTASSTIERIRPSNAVARNRCTSCFRLEPWISAR
jgi:hypothetical protein